MSVLDDDRRNRMTAAWLGVFLLAGSAAVIAGWCLHVPALVQILPSLPPVPFNAALGVAFLGAGILSVAWERFGLAAILSIMPVGIGLTTLAAWILDFGQGIDELLLRHYITTLTPIPGRMPVNNAFSLVLAGAAVGLASLPSRPRMIAVAWILGAMTLGRGLLGTAWSLLDIAGATPDYPGTAHMTVQFGVAMALAGSAAVLLAWRRRNDIPPGERIWELPIFAGVVSAMTSLLLWQALTVADDTRLRLSTRETLSAVSDAIRSEAELLDTTIRMLARQAERDVGSIPLSHWQLDVEDHFRGTPWLRQVVWVDARGSVLVRAVRDPSEGLPVPVSSLAFTQRNADPETGPASPTMWTPDALNEATSKSLAVLLMPIDESKGGGGLEFTIRIDEMLGEAVGSLAKGYEVLVTDRGRPLFSRMDADGRVAPRPYVLETARLSAYGKELDLQVKPSTNGILDASALTRLVLLFGVTLSLLVTVVLRYAAVARWRSAGIAEAGERLKREVEDRRRAELSARESEARAQRALADVQQVLHQSQDLICIVDRDGRFRVVSPASRRILGYEPVEMIGHHWSEFVYPGDVARTAPEVDAIRAGKVTSDFENRYVHRDGHLVHLSWSSTWVADSGASYSIGRDVTTRNRQVALREGQHRVLQLIVEGVPRQQVLDAICANVEQIDPESSCSILLVDADGTRLRSTSGPSLPAEYVDAVDGIAIGPAMGCCGTAAWRKQLVVVEDIETDPLWDAFRHLALKHGLRSCWSMPIRGENGAVLGTFAIYHESKRKPEPHEIDVIEAAAGLAAVAIEREEAHARLVEGKEQLEFARRVAQLGYWEFYPDSGKVSLSQDQQSRLGLPLGKDQLFVDLLRFVVEADRTKLVAARDALAGDVGPVDSEIRLQMPDGEVRYVMFRGRTVRRQDGSVVKLAGTVQDITKRKLIELENARLYAELEDRVRNRTRELEQSNRELEAFSYSVSHDLRAPLRAISGFGALLRDGYARVLGPQGEHYLDRIIAGTGRMSALIDDLLELGRVSRIEIVRQSLDLTALATQVAARLRERSPERHVDVSIEPGMAGWGDTRLIEVVFENLLENAWKFTSGREVGQIRIGTVQDRGEHAFFVSDNGVGFDPQYAANLFGVFQRLHAASAFPGTGVGLATVQRILQRHGGRIRAEAQPDCGATFYFTLP